VGKLLERTDASTAGHYSPSSQQTRLGRGAEMGVPLGKFVAHEIRDATGPSPDAGLKAKWLRVSQQKWLSFDPDSAE
jgi:hypothetical protein